MKPGLTIVLITSRNEPRLEWFVQSLELELVRVFGPNTNPWHSNISVIVVDSQAKTRKKLNYIDKLVEPKPTVWSGEHRITKENWWSASNARNTGICLCETEHICFVDDRCVLLPGWLDGIRRAMSGNYCVAGWYQKRVNMTVENGTIKHGGTITGDDSREKYLESQSVKDSIVAAPPEWTYGCSLAMPLEWILQIGGFEEEHCDGLGSEDSFVGLMLNNNGFPIKYDRSMQMCEDRTPAASLPVMRREDVGQSPHDKSHACLAKLKDLKHTLNRFDIRAMRNSVLAGNPFPPPTGSHTDWYDGRHLSEL